MTTLITTQSGDARVPALVDDYNAQNHEIGQRILHLFEEMHALHSEWCVMDDTTAPELLAILREEVWSHHPEWKRSNPRQVHHVEMIARDWAQSLAVLRFRPAK